MVRYSFIALAGLLGTGVDASYAITKNNGGVNTQTGAVPDRLEINTLASQAGPQWDLFIVCMAELQARPQGQQDSWYQMAGVHGRPYAAWDNVHAASGNHAGGYCPHSSVLFPTWHRPYLQLIEQNIWQCAQRRAAAYPTATRQTYVNAAVTLRFPYWDWMQTATLPPVVTQTYVTVNSQFGRVSLVNPLYQYRFATNGPGGPNTSDFPSSSGAPAGFAQTARQASSGGVTNNAAANAALANSAGYLHDATYQVLTKTKVYGEMANNGYPGQITGAGSLENPHGSVHNLVGGSYGDMTYLDYSAFDPIFWFHHCNVDRLFAIWQAINPNTWSINQVTESGTYAVTAGATETSRTPLYPFSKDTNGNLYTSDDVRKTTDLGYTYPEIRPWGKTATKNAQDVTAAIRTLYDPQNQLSRRDQKMHKRSKCVGGKTPPLDPSKVVVHGKYKQWGLNLEVNKFALAASFNIFFFLGSAGNDSTQWAFDSHLVGSVAVLRPMGDNTPTELTIYGAVPLTRAMLDAVDEGQLKNLDVSGAVPHLQKHLQWRLAYLNGTEVPISQVPSLKVSVNSQEVTQPQSITDLPQYGDVTQHLNVTEGKPGSATGADLPSNSTTYSGDSASNSTTYSSKLRY